MIITRKAAHELVAPYVQGCDEDHLDRLIFLGQSDLWNSGKWYGMLRKVFLTINDGRVVLPREYNVLQALNLDGFPRPIESEWFEFSPNGPGSDWECNPTGTVYDLMDVPTFLKIKQGEQVSVKSTHPEDEGAHVVVQGINSDGNIIYRSYSDINCTEREQKTDLGERLKLTCDSFHQTYSYFAENGITQIFKPVTKGEVEVFATGPRYARKISVLGPSDTYSALRAYRVPESCRCRPCIEGLVKLREPQRLTQDHEVLLIEDPNALISICMSVFYTYDKLDPVMGATYFAKAINALNGRQVEKNGGIQRRLRVWQPANTRDKRRSPIGR